MLATPNFEQNQPSYEILTRRGQLALPMTTVPETSIFVGSLLSSTSEQDLLRCFGVFGQIILVSLPKFKKKKTNKGFAFIQFATQLEKFCALRAPIKLINGKEIFVRDCLEQDQARELTLRQSNLKLFVRNLSGYCTESELASFLDRLLGFDNLEKVQFRYSS